MYKVRPGIVHIKVCDADLLVVTRKIWEGFPGRHVRTVPRLWAACWAVMEKDGKTDQDAVNAFTSLLRRPEEQIRKRLEKCFTTLAEEGYMIYTEEEAADEECHKNG